MLRWYVVQTKSYKEDFVTTQLVDAGFDIFNPKMKSFSMREGDFITKPFFPGYVFVHTEMEKTYKMVKYTRGVLKILGIENEPIPIDDRAIEIIKERTNNEGIIEQKLTLRKGARVRIKEGVFRDLVGILESPPDDKGRIKVLLDMIKYSAHVSCSWRHVELE
jgi:transcriptional antiterminator RfaH